METKESSDCVSNTAKSIIEEIGFEEFEKFLRVVGVSVVRQLINRGDIEPQGKTGKQIFDGAQAYFGSGIEVLEVNDHTDSLLKQARAFKQIDDKKEFACVFYALWLEHRINGLLLSLAERKNFTPEEGETLVKEANFRMKSNLLLRLLGVEPFDSTHAKVMNKIMEVRNGFVHYKWKPQNHQTEKELDIVLDKIEAAIEYLENYEVENLGFLTHREVADLLGFEKPSSVPE